MFSLRKKEWLWLAILSAVLIFLRIPSLFESWWYGDENIYMAVGQGIASGQWLYSDVWDNKPPLIYIIYAISYTLFGSALWPIRFLNIMLSVIAVLVFYLISQKIFKFNFKWSLAVASVFVIILASGLEGTIFNAENIFMPLILTGFFSLFWQLRNYLETGKISWIWVILGSIIWALAAFTKVQAILEIGLLTLIFLIIFLREWGNKFWKNQVFWCFFITIATATALPYLVLLMAYGMTGQLEVLFFSLVGFGGDYIATNNVPVLFGFGLDWLSGVQLRAVLLVITLVGSTFLFWKKHISQKWFLLINWLAIVFFASMLSERNYPHYLLQVLPVLTLVGAVVLQFIQGQKESLLFRLNSGLLSLLVLQTFLTNFTQGQFFWNYYSPQQYFIGFVQVATGYQSLQQWRENYNKDLLSSQSTLVEQIQLKTNPEDKIYLVANRPDLYFLSERTSGQRFIVDFHYPQHEIPNIYNTLIENNTRLVMVDKKSDKAELFLEQISIDYNFSGELLERYSFWLKK